MLLRQCFCLAFTFALGTIQVTGQQGIAPMHTANAGVQTQPNILPQYQPTRTEMLERYRKAAIMDSVVRQTVFKTALQPNWLDDGERFWYRNVLRDSLFEYWIVDPARGTKKSAFDAARMAAALHQVSGKTATPEKLHLTNMVINKNDVVVQFGGEWYKVGLKDYVAKRAEVPQRFKATANADQQRGNNWAAGNPGEVGPVRRRARAFRSDSVSADKQWVAFVRDYNVFVRPASGDGAVQLTTDGTKEKPYGQLAWSPDSKKLVGYRIKPVQDKQVHYVLTAASGTRGELKSRGYAQPGDENTSYEMFLFQPDKKAATKVGIDVIDYGGAPFINWRKEDSRYFTFERTDRGHQRFRIIEVDTETGAAKELLEEKTATFIFEQRILTHYLPETAEIIWVTEKDGWRHIYLVDEKTGKEKVQVTKGSWVVREVDSIDVKKREIWFQASGMNEGEDPYFIHYYRIGFDGNNLVKLTEANANHRLQFSPSRQYYIDQYSRVDLPTVMELRRTSDGKKVMQVDEADVAAYAATGIKYPEVFVAKGRDGVTDIWGVVFRPSNFDAAKRYPIIEQIYAGPQGSFVPKNFSAYSEPQSLAELGFVVVQIDGMGTYNRSKAFHDVAWKNLADAGFPDRILWMKALAQKYPYADTSRVGIYGTSAGGQNSAGALLFHPEFYDAAVSACGCHDNRVDKQWWNEQWMGYPVGKHYDEQSNITNAHKLQGALMLVVGEADENVPPESTYRVADALIKAGKDFEFLAIPGMGHSDGGAYGRKKKRDFFVKHLHGVDPPRRNISEL
jgi:dipeptidyl aminopeptidase/acylaminoacyl peptidase